MSEDPAWPEGASGALSLTFDNLGEAAELELGAIGPDERLGEHFTATRVLPEVLDALEARSLAATFFVEGVNAEMYPDQLREIDARGHELGYHAWRHEQWDGLSAAEQSENLARGQEGFRALGLEIAGLRPPGGGLGQGGTGAVRAAGLRYCSPAGLGASVTDGVSLLPFGWRHVDASCVLPPLSPVREQITGSPEPIEPDAFLDHLVGEIERLAADGGCISFVLHLFMIDWLGTERLDALLDRAGSERDVWVAPCAEIAAHVLSRPGAFRAQTEFDTTSWTG